MGAGMYHIRVVGELDSTRIRAELDRISKSYRMIVGGGGVGGGATGKGKAGGGIVQLGKDAEQTKKRLQGLNGQVVRNEKALKGFHTGFSNTGKEVEKSTGKLRAFGTETLHVSKKVVQFGAVTAVIRGVTSGFSDMVQKTFELDAALTEFKKVSDLSGKGLEQYTDKAFRMGRSVAKTGTEMIEAATEFRKSGFNDQDSLKLGQVAMMFSNIADSELSAGDAAGFITSQIKANFNDVSNDATKASQQIIDAINEVSNTQAVSSTDLSMAMSKVGSAMKVNNNTYAQSLGMVTAGTEIMHGQASKVGRGLRTIGANISKMQKDAKTLDVQTKDGVKTIDLWDKKTNQVKNTYEVFKEFAGVWDDMNPDQQQALSLQMAGKNQQEVFASVIGNWKNAEKAAETAAKQINEGGSAAKENAKYLESMQGHLENLKSAWSEFSNAMMSSSALNKGMDVLASILRFLASDGGKAVITLSLLATGFNLLAKAALGLKGLSIVKLFSGLGGAFTNITKGSKGAIDGLKVMQGAQVGATRSAIPLYSAFGKLTASLLGSTGLVAGIGLLSVALAEYVPIGERARDIKLGKELKEAQSDVEKTEKKYKSLRDELDKLHEKEKEGTLTDSEQNRLNILENQTKQYERQLELKKQLATNKADEYYHTVDPSKLEGKAKDKYTLAKSAGKSDKEALAAAGIHDKIALALNNEQAQAEKTASAQQKVIEAYEHYGEESSQYKNALEDLGEAQKAQGDSLSQLEKKRKKAIEDYGSEEEANKKLGKSWKDLNKEIASLKVLKGLNFKKPSKDIDNLKKNAQNLGLEFDKSGKKINSIDLKTFSQKMTEAGYSVEDTWDYIQKLSKENPNIKVNIDGTEVAAKDLEFVDGQIKEIDKSDAEVDIDAKDNASAKMKKIKADKNLGKAQKKLEESGGGKVQSTMGKLTNKKSLGKANKKLTQTGGDKVSSKMNSLSAKTSLGTATKTIKFGLSGAVSAAKKVLGFKKGIRHFAAGGQNDKSSIFPNAEVNEQGFEIIQDGKTGLMRVVNGGKRGATHLGEGDAVFTHGQSVRMLRNAGLTEGDVIYGHGDDDFGLFGIEKLKGFKKGKKKKKKKSKKQKKKEKKNRKKYNEKYEAIKNSFQSQLATLEYKKDYYNWTDAEFNKQYKKLFDKQNKALKNLNNSKTGKAKGVTKKTTLGTDIVRAYNLAMRQTKSEKDKKNIENLISNTRGTNADLTKTLKAINAADKAQTISADEAKEYKMQAYKSNVDYNLKQFQNNKKDYKSSIKLLQDYYKQGKLTATDYYSYLETLAKDQLDKEKQRLTEQQTKLTNTYDLAKAYVQRQIDLLETENKEQEKQNDLVELQNNLAKARNQRVRIYKEGEGFVYEKDTEAIREATNALKEYQSNASNTEEALNPVLVQWQNVLKLFDEFEADYNLKALENKVGATVSQLFGSFGTNTSSWSKWIKNNLSTTQGIGDVLTNLDKLVDTNDIIKYLDSNGQVSQSVINAAIKNNALPTTYAAPVTQQGISAGVNTAANLATQSSITTATSGAVVMGSATQYGNIYNFDNLVLPNVTNANEFINGLNNLSTTALQTSTQRG